jgi:hypothetical protein
MNLVDALLRFFLLSPIRIKEVVRGLRTINNLRLEISILINKELGLYFQLIAYN